MRALIATNVTLPGVSVAARNDDLRVNEFTLLEFPGCSHDSSPPILPSIRFSSLLSRSGIRGTLRIPSLFAVPSANQRKFAPYIIVAAAASRFLRLRVPLTF